MLRSRRNQKSRKDSFISILAKAWLYAYRPETRRVYFNHPKVKVCPDQAELCEIHFPHKAVEVSTDEVELTLYTSPIKILVGPIMIKDLKRAIASGEGKAIFLNQNVLDTLEDSTYAANDPEVVIIDRPPAGNTRGRSGKPLGVNRHIDIAVYGILPPCNFKDEYVSARSHGEVFHGIDNRIIDPTVDNAVSKWISEFDKHKCYAKREILFQSLRKGNKGRAKDRCGCIQEVLYRIQVTHKKLFTREIIDAARKLSKGYNYSKKNNPLSPLNGWLGL